MKFKLTTLGLILFTFTIKAQTSVQLSSSEIKLRLQKLGVTASVLYIAAHPDDENTRLLSYLSSERKVRTGYLSLTRGDGGQNLIGAEQAEELGLIRTQELLAARRIDGAEQFFTRANDFGFSKTSAETFKIWDKERILGDVVWVIRKFRPDVIITRFPGDARAGHGHHAASSLLAQDAFTAAADPKRFPEQLKTVKPWKAKRIFWNTFNFGGNNTTADNQLKIDAGNYNFLLGKSYGEIAAESRSQHKSQGFGVARQRGEAIEYFSLLNGEPAAKDLLEGVDLGWSGIKQAKEIEALLSKINREYSVEQPQNSVPDLLKLHSLISALDDNQLRERKLKDVTDLILAAAGIWVEAYSTQPAVAVGESMPLRIQAISRYGSSTKLDFSFGEKAIQSNLVLPSNQLKTADASLKASALSQPYWLANKHGIGEYVINDMSYIGFPENPDRLSISFNLTIGNQKLSFERPVVYKYTDQIRGEVYQNLDITPPVVADLKAGSLLFANGSTKELSIKLIACKNNSSGRLKLVLPEGWKAEPATAAFNFAKEGDDQTFVFKISSSTKARSGKLRAELEVDGQAYSKSLRSIRYEHIPVITWYPEAEANLTKLDIRTAGRNIAYIPGAGDLVPDALKQIGYNVTTLSTSDLENTDLQHFDAIVTGVRLYNTRPEMKKMNDRLLKYVENGGVLLIQYNVNQPLVLSNIGPYPFTITRNRVTEEDAKITILDPKHPVFNYPNKISEDDFQNWIQERGIYYVNDESGSYQQLLSMSDTGEQEQKGSLLVTKYGKGRFVYTGLAFFRQLPAGVPGAYRLFVNLLSKPDGE